MNYIKLPVALLLVCVVVAFSVLLYGCITAFEPKGIEEVSDLLIIDGTITNGESVFKLSHSVGLTEELKGNEYINGASVYIETDAGDTFKAVQEIIGTYTIPTGELDANKQYRLNVEYNGRHYQSPFLAPLITPEIDSISVQKKGKGEMVNICVNTHDPKNLSKYYRWSYKETWEVQANLYANAREENGRLIMHEGAENTLYCWVYNYSHTLLLGSTEKLSENIISGKRIAQIPPGSDCLSVLYRIEVDQIQLRKEAHDYFSNLQKNVEQTGSLFTPMPSEMKGNITCLTDPDLPVIGYIEVATTTKIAHYIPVSANLYEPPRRECPVIDDTALAIEQNYAIYEYLPMRTTYAPLACVDCRLRGTKKRPEDWPNNHY